MSVNGRLSSESDPAVMRVRTIKVLSGAVSCGYSSGCRGTGSGSLGKSDVKTLTGCVDEQPGPKYVLIGPEIKTSVLNSSRWDSQCRILPGFLDILFRYVASYFQTESSSYADKQLGDIREQSDHCAPQ